jgi:twitching motility protein PilT
MSTSSRNLPVSLEEILDLALELKASDIHFKANMAPVLRIDGRIRSVAGLPVFDGETLRSMMVGMLNRRQQQQFEENWELDTAIYFADKARVRINLYTDIDSVGCAMRIVPLEVPTLEHLGLPNVIEQLTHNRQGLILVTGVTGAGKSTTLAAMIDAINSREAMHIYTMEDPIEFVHRPKRSVITQREIGYHTKTFGTALKSALRADPNILLIGEMRDAETMLWALKAAETGHLVLSTLHTASAPKTIQRILGAFNAQEQEVVRMQLAYSLKAVVAQQLIPLMEGGRAAVHEIMINTLTIQEAIMRGEIDGLYEYIKNGSFDGMQTMDGSIYNAYRQGFIDADTAKTCALNSGEMDRILRGASVY